MRILFISRGTIKNEASTLVIEQGKSLAKIGHDVNYFIIKGKGILAYLRCVPKIRKKIRSNHYDIIHTHFGLSAIPATLAGARPLVVSLMGSDIRISHMLRKIIRKLHYKRWAMTVLKSNEMNNIIGLTKYTVIPNGVDLDRFYPMSKEICQKKLKWESMRKHVVFPSSPTRYEKNFPLVREALEQLDHRNSISLHILENIPPGEVLLYYNAADLIVVSSLWEGSPNAVKEAMACNRPVISTNVGDIDWLFHSVEGCFIAPFDSSQFAKLMQEALDNYTSSTGRNKIISLRLDSEAIANRLSETYNLIFSDNDKGKFRK